MTQDVAATTDKGWSQSLADLYAEGYSDAEVAAHLRVTMKNFYKEMENNPAFRQLVEFGRTLALAWWESQYRKNINNKNFNTAMLNFYMKNKHGWADKVDTTGITENTNVNLDELRESAMKQVAAFIKKNTPELTDAQRVISGLGSNLEQ